MFSLKSIDPRCANKRPVVMFSLKSINLTLSKQTSRGDV